jgi:hypothetical protein
MSEKKITVELTEVEAIQVATCIRLANWDDEVYLMTHNIDSDEAHERAAKVRYYLDLADKISGIQKTPGVMEMRRF